MQPFVNPNYFNPYQQMYQPPQLQPQPLPSYTPNIAQNGLSGKYVNDFSEITANDVPMSGSGAMFIKNDLSEIQVRNWNANGLIDIKTYKPYIAPVSTLDEQEPVFDIPKALSGIDERLDKLESLLKRKGRKEVSEDE